MELVSCDCTDSRGPLGPSCNLWRSALRTSRLLRLPRSSSEARWLKIANVQKRERQATFGLSQASSVFGSELVWKFSISLLRYHDRISRGSWVVSESCSTIDVAPRSSKRPLSKQRSYCRSCSTTDAPIPSCDVLRVNWIFHPGLTLFDAVLGHGSRYFGTKEALLYFTT